MDSLFFTTNPDHSIDAYDFSVRMSRPFAGDVVEFLEGGQRKKLQIVESWPRIAKNGIYATGSYMVLYQELK